MNRILPIIVALIVGLLLGYCYGMRQQPPPPPVVLTGAGTHTVGISGTAAPFNYTVDPVLVRPGDFVTWTSAQADWSVDLTGVPADPSNLLAAAGDSARAVILLTAAPDTYKYSVTLTIAGQPVTDDPRIIVEE